MFSFFKFTYIQPQNIDVFEINTYIPSSQTPVVIEQLLHSDLLQKNLD